MVREDDEDIEEERRIFYVCITRARQKLVLTAASRRRVFGEYNATVPSRFLEEVPAELVQKIETSVQSPRWQQPSYDLRNPYAHRPGQGRGRVREKSAPPNALGIPI